jgi:tRNA U34 5-carboxymethylaminomethyl modifying GTPase MnmE/TrmE
VQGSNATATLVVHSKSEITGDFSSDDLLGVIFSSFCIGK